MTRTTTRTALDWWASTVADYATKLETPAPTKATLAGHTDLVPDKRFEKPSTLTIAKTDLDMFTDTDAGRWRAAELAARGTRPSTRTPARLLTTTVVVGLLLVGVLALEAAASQSAGAIVFAATVFTLWFALVALQVASLRSRRVLNRLLATGQANNFVSVEAGNAYRSRGGYTYTTGLHRWLDGY